MKKIITFVLMIVMLLSCGDSDEYNYTGVVKDRKIENATAGYKSSTPTTHYLILKDVKSKKFFRVNVTINTYYNINILDTITFRLSNFDMYNLGNTNDPCKNLYGK